MIVPDYNLNPHEHKVINAHQGAQHGVLCVENTSCYMASPLIPEWESFIWSDCWVQQLLCEESIHSGISTKNRQRAWERVKPEEMWNQRQHTIPVCIHNLVVRCIYRSIKGLLISSHIDFTGEQTLIKKTLLHTCLSTNISPLLSGRSVQQTVSSSRVTDSAAVGRVCHIRHRRCEHI